MTATGVVWDPVYLDHVTDDGHPDHPRRLKPLYRRLEDPVVYRRFTTIVPPVAADEEILLVHSPSYLNQVKATATCTSSALSADTLTCDRSYQVAAMAVGGTLEAIRQVVAGTLSHALVLARPPGHHAERTRAMGYCIFNNVAIGSMAARMAMGLARVMVVDWDLHHGNGTQHMFERDPSVFFFSSHQFPHYPGTGHLTETIYQRLLTPVARAFKPELILVSAGFDIHGADPLGGMKVTPAGFAGLTRLILGIARQTCAGRVVFCLEGGYNADALADSALAMINELTGRTSTDVAAMAANADPGRLNAVVDRCIHTHRRFWKELDR
ncbi:MAG: histone deacetylase [Desulfosarcina sp.]|nr:histone deacetylase [Desulfosarcina sp.]